MAATGTPTPNIGLRCPQGTDPASVDDINYNSGVIDTKLGAVGNTSVQEQINTLNSKTVRFWEGSVTTDSNGRFNANSTINVAGASKPVILGITCYEAWYHFRLYHGSNYNTMVQVTDYDVNTPKPNVTLTVRIAYAY